MSERLNSKARSEAIQRTARALLVEQQIDVNEQVVILPLAKLLVDRERCHLTTAKIHIATAIRRSRGDITAGREWGGPRPGAGRPAERETANDEQA